MNKFEMFLVVGLYFIPTILAIIWQVIDLEATRMLRPLRTGCAAEVREEH